MKDRIGIVLIILQLVMLGIVMKGYAIFLPLGITDFRVVEIKAASLAVFFAANIALFYILVRQKKWDFSTLFLFGMFVVNSILTITIFANGKVWLPKTLKYVIFILLIFALLMVGSDVKKNKRKKKPVEAKVAEIPKPKETFREIPEAGISPEKPEEKRKFEELAEEISFGKIFEKPKEEQKKQGKKDFVASKTGKIFHKINCKLAKGIKGSKKVFFSSVEEASDAGYEPCKRCMA